MPQGGCQGDHPLTQRGACSGGERSETSQNSRWLVQPDPNNAAPDLAPKVLRKKKGYSQIRLYLPNDTMQKLLPLPPSLRNSIVSYRLRAMEWDVDFRLEELQDGATGIKLACTLLEQALVTGILNHDQRVAVDHLIMWLKRIIKP